MTHPGTADNPLRVAIVGAGPAGFYAADHLLKHKHVVVSVDMFDRLPTPFGLVRGGVAPDHQKIKSVTKAYHRTASHPHFRFFGYVEIGTDITVDDLRTYYHQIVYTNGAQTDRSMGIPGEDLPNSHAATEFVAWYNGHPDYRNLTFDLQQERVAVIGVGNVAVDVARILCKTPDELAKTDIADYALDALSQSKVKEVIMLGRRGPAQAAFTNPEIRELGELEDTDIRVRPEEAALDPITQEQLDKNPDRITEQKVDILRAYAARPRLGKSRVLTLRFLVSPTAITGNGKVRQMTLVKNELYLNEHGLIRPRATERIEAIEVGLVFRSVGYRGVALPGVPFHDRWGVIPNDRGRVVDFETRTPVLGEYTAGWIKRGPSGVIGTNKPDSVETADMMLTDLGAGQILSPEHPNPADAETFIRRRKPAYFSYEDWLKLDEMEVSRGQALGRPRLKFTTVEEMSQALGR